MALPVRCCFSPAFPWVPGQWVDQMRRHVVSMWHLIESGHDNFHQEKILAWRMHGGRIVVVGSWPSHRRPRTLADAHDAVPTVAHGRASRRFVRSEHPSYSVQYLL